MISLRIPLVALVSLVATLGFASPGDLIVVDVQGHGDFYQVQPAIDHAMDGDTIIILPGGYNGFQVIGKSLSLLGDTAQFVRVHGPVLVSSIGGNQSVSIGAMDMRGGFEVLDCAGFVNVADCHMLASFTWDSLPTSAQRVVDCNNVVFSRCSLNGRVGGGGYGDCLSWQGRPGESGVYLDNSRVAFYSCQAQGGLGGYGYGADFCWLHCETGWPGRGGDGIRAENSEVYLDDSAPVGGIGGEGCGYCTSVCYGPPGVAVRLSGTSFMNEGTNPRITLEGQTLVRENDPLPLTIGGPEGSRVWALWSESSRWRPFGGDLGILHLGGSQVHLEFIGIVPAGGVLDAPFVAPPLLPGHGARRLFMQVYAISAPEGRLLGTPSTVDVIDSAY